MGSFGMKVSQPGKDVKRAGDVDLLFSSSWPLLPIVKEGWVDGELLDTAAAFSVPHDLKFTPAAIFFDMRNNASSFGKRQNTSVRLVSFDDKITFQNVGGGGFGSIPKNSFYYYIFNLDIKTNYQAPSIDLGSLVAGGTGDYGIKASVEGKSTSSNTINDHTIHTATRSPMVHSVEYARSERRTDGFAFYYGKNFVHQLPYSPIYLAYVESGDGMVLVEDRTTLASEIDGSVTTGQQTITVEYIDSDVGKYGTQNVSLVLFKDPFESDKTEVINYV